MGRDLPFRLQMGGHAWSAWAQGVLVVLGAEVAASRNIPLRFIATPTTSLRPRVWEFLGVVKGVVSGGVGTLWLGVLAKDSDWILSRSVLLCCTQGSWWRRTLRKLGHLWG